MNKIGCFIIGGIVGFVGGFFARKIVDKVKEKKEELKEAGFRPSRETDVPDEFKRVKKGFVRPSGYVTKEAEEKEQELAEAEFPRDDDPDDPDYIPSEMEESWSASCMHDFDYQTYSKWEPRPVLERDIGNFPSGWTEESLYYFVKNDVLTDEMDNVILEAEREQMVRRCLELKGFNDPDERIVPDKMFVANFANQKIYAVHRILDEYREP